MGLSYYSKSLELLHKRDYEGASKQLKKSLKEIKEAEQEKSLVYLKVLNQLAVVSFLSQNMPQAERYFTICKDMAKTIPDVEDNGFDYHNSLLEFYLQTDLVKAKGYINDLLEEDFSTQNLKRVRFSLANYHLLNQEYSIASEEYRKILKLVPDDRLKGQIFNNMNISDIRLAEGSPISEVKQKDFIAIFKESISILEDIPQVKKHSPQTDIEKEITKEILDLKTIVPKDYSTENIDRYTGVLKNRESGKVITNIAEFLLFHSQNSQDLSFWFKFGLDFHQTTSPDTIDRFLVYLAVFYSSTGQVQIAEKLFTEVLNKMDQEFSYTKAMGMNMYGRMLTKDPNRKQQAMSILEQSEGLTSILPHWYNNLENIFTLDALD